MKRKLGVGFIGSGFITRFHMQSWVAVRDADVTGVWSPNRGRAEEAAAFARSLQIGETKAYGSIEEMVQSPEVDCIWLCGPNHARVENVERIVDAMSKGAKLVGIATEKPLARNVAEAKKIVGLIEKAGLLHGYLENQLFCPGLGRARDIAWARGAAVSGRPYLARAAEEHGGPHMPWFWRGDMQGGGVLNDMMCHSLEVGRHLLTKPGAPRGSIKPVKVSAQIASLKWSLPSYADELKKTFGPEVDYRKSPAEDFARATVRYVDVATGQPLISEATTSWSFVGAGLRLSMELLGPEYSMSVNTLDTGAKIFFSRRVHGAIGEDLVEKQNAEQGLMPLLGSETSEYGYEGENRHFARKFAEGVQPEESWHAGLEVVELLMASYMSAEQEKALDWKPAGLDAFIPAVARGTWKP
jgi:predicted dehydrogenase